MIWAVASEADFETVTCTGCDGSVGIDCVSQPVAKTDAARTAGRIRNILIGYPRVGKWVWTQAVALRMGGPEGGPERHGPCLRSVCSTAETGPFAAVIESNACSKIWIA